MGKQELNLEELTTKIAGITNMIDGLLLVIEQEGAPNYLDDSRSFITDSLYDITEQLYALIQKENGIQGCSHPDQEPAEVTG